jgi:hypothetical protein
MAPKKEGFNWAGYFVPFAALGAGAIALVTVLRGMQRRAQPTLVTTAGPSLGTDDEIARLNEAVRRDD